VTEARETEIAINDSRNKYRPVAKRGAMLFFLLNSLNKIHAFYQYSLNAFVNVFARGLDQAPGGRKKKEEVSLQQLARRLSGNARDYDEVMAMARRTSSMTGGSRRPTLQAGRMTG
jgi:dynein heavy chain